MTLNVILIVTLRDPFIISCAPGRSATDEVLESVCVCVLLSVCVYKHMNKISPKLCRDFGDFFGDAGVA